MKKMILKFFSLMKLLTPNENAYYLLSALFVGPIYSSKEEIPSKDNHEGDKIKEEPSPKPRKRLSRVMTQEEADVEWPEWENFDYDRFVFSYLYTTKKIKFWKFIIRKKREIRENVDHWTQETFPSGIYNILKAIWGSIETNIEGFTNILNFYFYLIESFFKYIFSSVYNFTYVHRYFYWNYIYYYLNGKALRYYRNTLWDKFLGVFLNSEQKIHFYEAYDYWTVYLRINILTGDDLYYAILLVICIFAGFFDYWCHLREEEFEERGYPHPVYLFYQRVMVRITHGTDPHVNLIFVMFMAWGFFFHIFFPTALWGDRWDHYWWSILGASINDAQFFFRSKRFLWGERTYDWTKDIFYTYRWKILVTPMKDIISADRFKYIDRWLNFMEARGLFNAYVDQWENRPLGWRSYIGMGYCFVNPGANDAHVGNLRYYPELTPFSTLVYWPTEFSPHWAGAASEKNRRYFAHLGKYWTRQRWKNGPFESIYRQHALDGYMFENWFWYDFAYIVRIWYGGPPGHYRDGQSKVPLRKYLDWDLYGYWFHSKQYRLKNKELFYESPFSIWQDQLQSREFLPPRLIFPGEKVISNRKAVLRSLMAHRIHSYDRLRR